MDLYDVFVDERKQNEIYETLDSIPTIYNYALKINHAYMEDIEKELNSIIKNHFERCKITTPETFDNFELHAFEIASCSGKFLYLRQHPEECKKIFEDVIKIINKYSSTANINFSVYKTSATYKKFDYIADIKKFEKILSKQRKILNSKLFSNKTKQISPLILESKILLDKISKKPNHNMLSEILLKSLKERYKKNSPEQRYVSYIKTKYASIGILFYNMIFSMFYADLYNYDCKSLSNLEINSNLENFLSKNSTEDFLFNTYLSILKQLCCKYGLAELDQYITGLMNNLNQENRFIGEGEKCLIYQIISIIFSLSIGSYTNKSGSSRKNMYNNIFNLLGNVKNRQLNNCIDLATYYKDNASDTEVFKVNMDISRETNYIVSCLKDIFGNSGKIINFLELDSEKSKGIQLADIVGYIYSKLYIQKNKPHKEYIISTSDYEELWHLFSSNNKIHINF